MPRRWNDERLRRKYERVKEDARNDGFTEDELSSHYLDKLSHQTKSGRIMRMVRLAYTLGWLRGIDNIDQGKTPVTLDGCATENGGANETD